jgi:hypothetical protein
MTQSNFSGSTSGNSPTLASNTTIVTPFDRVRWGPIWAGIFTALSTLAVLGVLGLAIGATVYDRNDSGRAFGIGAGIWGVLSYLIAFALGGWIAARSAIVAGSRNGLLNGSMVWAVAIPLMLFVLGGGLAAAVGAASNVASNPGITDNAGAGGSVIDQAQTASSRIGANTGTSNTTVEDVRRTSARTAWWTLISLILGLAAAATGGYLGSHEPGRRHFSNTAGGGNSGNEGGNYGSNT